MTMMFFLVFIHLDNIMYRPFGTVSFVLLTQASFAPSGQPQPGLSM